jgi:hypothetical protein
LLANDESQILTAFETMLKKKIQKTTRSEAVAQSTTIDMHNLKFQSMKGSLILN